MATYLLIQSGTRLVMISMMPDSVSIVISEIVKTLALGFVYDFTVWSVIAIPLMIVLIIRKEPLIKTFVFWLYFFLIIIAVSQVLFFKEFGTNFNFIAVDYLIYTNELLGNIWQSFNIPLIMIAIFLAASGLYLLQRKYLKINRSKDLLNIKHYLAVIVLPFVMIPVIQSNWRESVSDNRYNVEIAGSGIYEFIRAYFTNELDYDTFYLTKSDLNINPAHYIDNSNELSNIKPNVVIITVESLNAEYLKIFGGSGLTPHLDNLSLECTQQAHAQSEDLKL